MIAPDARAGGMGDVGVATSPDVYSLFWNPAKYAFIEKDFGAGIGYVPWLRGLVNDIGLASVSGFKRFGDKQAVAASWRFFSMGEVTFTNDVGRNLEKSNLMSGQLMLPMQGNLPGLFQALWLPGLSTQTWYL